MFSVEQLQAGLNTEFLGREIKYQDQTHSTNDDAWECFYNHEPEGTLILTDYQVQGRGRHRSKWVSNPGKSLTFSFLLLPHLPLVKLGILPLLTGVSIVKGMYTIGNILSGLKWPNDIRIKGRKIAGILIEADTDVSGTDCFVGIGLNVNSNPNHFSTEFEATSLYSETFINFDMTEVLAVLLKHLDIRYHSIGSLDIVTEWKHLLDTIGQDIQITSKISNQVYNGNAIDVGKNGDLIVKLKDGSIREFPSGEVTLQQ